MDSEQKKRIFIYVTLLAIGLSVFYFYTNPDSFEALLGQHNNPATPQGALPATSVTPGADTEGTLGQEAHLDTQTLGDASEEDSISPPTLDEAKTTDMPHARDKITDALETIAHWRESNEPEIEILDEYFFHEKLWVRLGALETALETETYSAQQLQEIGGEVRSKYNSGQILRYLERSRHKSNTLFNGMQQALGFAPRAAPDEG